jgi:uncharacterized protein (TIGR02466 family)
MESVMASKRLFPSLVYQSSLIDSEKDLVSLNNSLIDDCFKISEIDEEGLEWCEKNYFGGYTSYASYNQLHNFSSSFEQLKSFIDQHLKHFLSDLQYDIEFESLSMTDCWLNIMPTGTHHSGHIHPHSVISGTYYLQVPEDSPAIKFEDPRLPMMMNAPKKLEEANLENRNFVSIPATEGELILFESFLRHEVPANLSEDDRISISFNYN